VDPVFSAQKCEASDAAKLGALKMVFNPGNGRHVDSGMGNAAPEGNEGMYGAVARSSCP
jgi:hypothetical protein